MKSDFLGYYQPTQEEFKDNFKDCIFSFDTNVLLNLYRFTHESQKAFFDVLAHGNFNDRIWLTHQVCQEFHDNRIDLIVEQKEMFNKLIREIDSTITFFSNLQKSEHYKSTEIIKPFITSLNKIRDELKDAKKMQPDLLINDYVLTELTNLFEKKAGKEYSMDEYKKLISSAKVRHDNYQPPGYRDSHGKKEKDGDKKFGDVILWHQLMDYAKEKKLPVIFVTDEKGEDWWLKKGDELIGPRPELRQEFYKSSGVWFYMYSTVDFLRYSKEYLNAKINQNVITEANDIKQKDEERQKNLEEYENNNKPILESMHLDSIIRDQERARKWIDASPISHQLKEVNAIDVNKISRDLENARKWIDSNSISRQLKAVKAIDLDKISRDLENARKWIDANSISRQLKAAKAIDIDKISRDLENARKWIEANSTSHISNAASAINIDKISLESENARDEDQVNVTSQSPELLLRPGGDCSTSLA